MDLETIIACGAVKFRRATSEILPTPEKSSCRARRLQAVRVPQETGRRLPLRPVPRGSRHRARAEGRLSRPLDQDRHSGRLRHVDHLRLLDRLLIDRDPELRLGDGFAIDSELGTIQHLRSRFPVVRHIPERPHLDLCDFEWVQHAHRHCVVTPVRQVPLDPRPELLARPDVYRLPVVIVEA